MKFLLPILLFLFALPAQAQYVQGGAVNAAPDTIGGDWTAKASYSFTFAKPLTSPCTIMVSIRYPGQVISDSQGNTFANATNNTGRYDELWYSTACFSGPDTVTVTCPSACWSEFTVSEYAGVWLPDQVSPEVVNVVGTDGWTAPINATPGELIIGIGNNHTTDVPQITGANGFTVRANANQFIADMLQTTAAPIYSEVTYSTPVNWCQRTISFKPGGPPPAFVYKLVGFGSFTFTMQAPPDCSAGDCSLVWTGPNGTVTLLPGQSGSLVIHKPTGDVVVVTIGP